MNKYFAAALPVAIGLAAAVGTDAVAQAAPVHFSTPQAAMSYLASASDHGNIAGIHHVTTPASFKEFMGMRPEFHNLRASSCKATGRGDYVCNLGYQYRDGKHWENATAQVIVAPAVNPGWYLYTFVSCG
jgi:hypothetical protein